MMRTLALIRLDLVMAWLGVTALAEAATNLPASAIANYTFDAYAKASSTSNATTGRGPPEVHVLGTIYNGDGH